jgi:hypothetical protein
MLDVVTSSFHIIGIALVYARKGFKPSNCTGSHLFLKPFFFMLQYPGAPEQIIEAIKAGHAKGEKVSNWQLLTLLPIAIELTG